MHRAYYYHPFIVSNDLTIALLNKLPCPLLIFSNQITWSRLLIQSHIINGKQCRSRSVGKYCWKRCQTPNYHVFVPFNRCNITQEILRRVVSPCQCREVGKYCWKRCQTPNYHVFVPFNRCNITQEILRRVVSPCQCPEVGKYCWKRCQTPNYHVFVPFNRCNITQEILRRVVSPCQCREVGKYCWKRCQTPNYHVFVPFNRCNITQEILRRVVSPCQCRETLVQESHRSQKRSDLTVVAVHQDQHTQQGIKKSKFLWTSTDCYMRIILGFHSRTLQCLQQSSCKGGIFDDTELFIACNIGWFGVLSAQSTLLRSCLRQA